MRAEPARDGAILVGPDRAGALRVVGAAREPPTLAPGALERAGALRRVGDVVLAPALGRPVAPPTLADGLARPEVVALADGVVRPDVVALADGLVRPEVVALADGVARPVWPARVEGFTRAEGLTLDPEARPLTAPRLVPGAVPVRNRSDGRVAPEGRTAPREAVALRPGATELLPPVTPLATPREETARPFTPARAGLAAAALAVDAPLAWGEPDRVGRL